MMIPILAIRETKKEMSKAFKIIDADGSGIIAFAEMKKVCKQLGKNLQKKKFC